MGDHLPNAEIYQTGMHQIELLNMTLVKRRSNQENSSLFRLPAEIRVMVLRELLVAEGPLSSPYRYEKPKPLTIPSSSRSTAIQKRKSLPRKAKNILKANSYKAIDEFGRVEEDRPKVVYGLHLYPAILATCQQLLIDGLHLLYKDNTVVLRTKINYEYCQGTGEIDWWPKIMFPAVSDFVNIIQSHGGQMLAHRWRSILERFDNMEIKLDAGIFNRRSYWQMMLALTPVVEAQNITVQVDTGYDLQSMRHTGRIIRSFQLLRCRDFRIVGTCRHFKGLESLADKITDIVKGTSPIVDLFACMDKFNSFRGLGKQGDPQRRILIQHFYDLDEAAESFDVAKFNEIRAKIFKIVDKIVKKTQQDALDA